MKSDHKIAHLPSTVPWAFVGNNTNNIGDDIQSLAAYQYFGAAKYTVNRDELADFSCDDSRVRCILNGWYLWGKSWPPAPTLEPLIVGFHIAENNGSKAVVGSPQGLDWMRKWQPIGCRSFSTMDFLSKKGIPCYFSGCVTLTLRCPEVPKHDSITWVDVSPPPWGCWDPTLQARLLADSIHTSHYINEATPQSDRVSIANHLLAIYAGSKLVVTDRLHAALPCIAFGTPVLFVTPKYERERVEPYLDMMSHWVTKESFVNGNFDFNWDNPPSPKIDLMLVDNLRSSIVDWAGLHSVYEETE